jgi:hypothetical protein
MTTESTGNTPATTKRFSDYSDEELLTLNNEQLNDAIRIEAIERGINPPITMPEALRRSEWRGYQKPAESIKVFVLKCGYYTSSFGFLDEALAQRALEGVVCVEENSYSTPKIKITTETPEIVTKFIGVEAGSQKASKFVEYAGEKQEEFANLRDECIEREASVRQAAYNVQVNLTKKAEYLRLAGGDRDIARNFWAKVERSMWPE